ncbi:hypothetical protein AK812_SmicGene18958 [Symbiodinium microadriaticum]|uniref:Uncharacterized protein n=1 Tax=Symbiodinium microadriaticum TaxID=2951 RepID=A0A1Q9DTT2_SYMMI|nr:hypothetical protein AK812_SmicGene18958 [Symbiodinium microadriaticum]
MAMVRVVGEKVSQQTSGRWREPSNVASQPAVGTATPPAGAGLLRGAHQGLADPRGVGRLATWATIVLTARRDFKKVFYSLPPGLRDVAYLAPDDVITDIKSIQDKDQRMAMCSRINALRRERLRHLATPQSAAFYDEDSTKIVPMSRVTERHFWDVFHRLPLSTTDSTKWKAVLKYLDGCPEKPRPNHGSSSSRDIEWASGDLCAGSPSSEQKPAPHVDTNSRDALRRLAEASPEQIVEKSSEVQEDYVDWVKRKVDVDTSNINFSNFDLETRVHKFSRKCPASKALSTLTPLQAMSDLYNDIYRIYLRKLERQISSLTSRSKEATALKKLCEALNIERDDSLPQLLARLRAIDIMKKPL